MRAIFRYIDGLLRGRSSVDGRTRTDIARLLLVILICGGGYGLVMGKFGGLTTRWLQSLYSGIKVPLLLLLAFAISLPSFFVLNSLAGLRNDFRSVLRALIGAQAGLTLVLLSLAPFTAFWYVCGSSYDAASLFNTAMFSIASFAAQAMLRRSYAPLIRQNPRHRTLLIAWLVIYAFVGIQTGWVLRPFLGSPNAPTQFFRASAWENGYIAMLKIARRALGI